MICRIAGFVALTLSCSAANSQSQWITTLMAGMPEHHCSEARGTEDGKAFVCTVWDSDPQKFSAPRQLEVYRNRQPIVTIEPGTPIREWHFWNRGEQLSRRRARRCRYLPAVPNSNRKARRPSESAAFKSE